MNAKSTSFAYANVASRHLHNGSLVRPTLNIHGGELTMPRTRSASELESTSRDAGQVREELARTVPSIERVGGEGCMQQVALLVPTAVLEWTCGASHSELVQRADAQTATADVTKTKPYAQRARCAENDNKIDLDCAVALAAAADPVSALRQFVPELNALKSAGEL